MTLVPFNDPFQQRMQIAFIFTMTCWALWWNIQWKQVMRFWVRPPNRRWVQLLFRVWFASCFVGALYRFAQEVHASHLTERDIGPTAGIAAIMCAVIALISAVGLWGVQRRDRRAMSGG
jgi:hypothetical protein